MVKYAFLSASASHRWLECPPSAKLCSEQEDRASPYAAGKPLLLKMLMDTLKESLC